VVTVLVDDELAFEPVEESASSGVDDPSRSFDRHGWASLVPSWSRPS
jgi:hypothetical protein